MKFLFDRSIRVFQFYSCRSMYCFQIVYGNLYRVWLWIPALIQLGEKLNSHLQHIYWLGVHIWSQSWNLPFRVCLFLVFICRFSFCISLTPHFVCKSVLSSLLICWCVDSWGKKLEKEEVREREFVVNKVCCNGADSWTSEATTVLFIV